LYVANNLTNTVSVINTMTETVIKTIPVGMKPHWLTVTPDGRHVYVANSVSATVSIIDTGTDEVIHTATTGPDPRGIGALPDGSAVFVVNHNSFSDASLTTIDPVTFSAETTPLPDIGVRSLAIADPTARIAGRVTFDGEPVAGAVLLAKQGDQQKGMAITNAAGDYSIFNLSQGIYDIHLDAQGHPAEIMPGQQTHPGRTTIVHFNLGTVDVEEITTNVPSMLNQNFPNPFSFATNIRYQLNRHTNVFLSIFDAQGNEVAILLNEEQTAGQHDILWQPTDIISSGIYFCRLQAGDATDMRKLLLMR
jgi:YVTN family beta-propeller protein